MVKNWERREEKSVAVSGRRRVRYVALTNRNTERDRENEKVHTLTPRKKDKRKKLC